MGSDCCMHPSTQTGTSASHTPLRPQPTSIPYRCGGQNGGDRARLRKYFALASAHNEVPRFETRPSVLQGPTEKLTSDSGFPGQGRRAILGACLENQMADPPTVALQTAFSNVGCTAPEYGASNCRRPELAARTNLSRTCWRVRVCACGHNERHRSRPGPMHHGRIDMGCKPLDAVSRRVPMRNICRAVWGQ